MNAGRIIKLGRIIAYLLVHPVSSKRDPVRKMDPSVLRIRKYLPAEREFAALNKILLSTKKIYPARLTCGIYCFATLYVLACAAGSDWKVNGIPMTALLPATRNREGQYIKKHQVGMDFIPRPVTQVIHLLPRGKETRNGFESAASFERFIHL